MSLTQAQSNFINSNAKFIRLLAPAGCGKTFSIIEKTKKLYSDNPKVKIAIFTFTKNAAEEIKSRCNNETLVSVHTLNSWGNSYIKSGILKNARLIDDAKSRKFFMLNSMQIVWQKAEHNIFADILNGRGKIRVSKNILDFIDAFNNLGFKHTSFSKDTKTNKNIYDHHLFFIKKVGLERYYNTLITNFIKSMQLKRKVSEEEQKHIFIIKYWIPFWKDCCEHMLKSGVYTFDGQKYFANIELEKRLNKNERWTGASKSDYIFIDEFQDTSPLDLILISNLQKLNDAALVIVGDDDQAIFEFRGATPYFILHPDELFEHKFQTHILDKNFRSPANIVQKSQQLIANNKYRVKKTVTTESNIPWAKIMCIDADSKSIVAHTIDIIKDILANTSDNVVILSRLKASLLPYQVLLTKENIDYHVSDDLAFFYTEAAEHLNRVLAIKNSNNIPTSDDFMELVCLFSKNEIYETARKKLAGTLSVNNANINSINHILLQLGLKEKIFSNLLTESFISRFMDALHNFLKASTVYETLDCLLNRFEGLQKNYSRSLEDIYYRDPPLASLLDFAGQYGTNFTEFCNDFTHAIDKTRYAEQYEKFATDEVSIRVTLSTALRVKGQEFDNVIILNANDGVWPKTAPQPEENNIESERRLFYVAITRAKKSLYLLSDKDAPKSPFLVEGYLN